MADNGAEVIGEMDDGTILDVGLWADVDPVEISPEDGLKPDAGFGFQSDVSDKRCAGSDISGWVQVWRGGSETLDALGEFSHEILS